MARSARTQRCVFGLYMANATFGNPAKSIFTSAGNIAEVAAAFQQDLG